MIYDVIARFFDFAIFSPENNEKGQKAIEINEHRQNEHEQIR